MIRPVIPAALCILLLAATLGGCKSLPMSGDETRHLPTGVEPGERVGLAVRSFVSIYRPGGDAPAVTTPASESVRMNLEQCLIDELQQPLGGATPLAPEPHAFPVAGLTAAAGAMPQPGPRYAVAVDATETYGKMRVLVVPLLIIMAYGHGRHETVEYRASIYDLGSGELAGTVRATSSGSAGTFFAAVPMGGNFERQYIDREGLCKDLATRVRLFLARQP